MAVLVVECDPKTLRIDDKKFPDRETHYIYEHLKYCLSKSNLLPAATISLDGDSPIVVQGQKYVRISVELGRASIRAIITGEVHMDDVQNFLRREDVRILDWRSIRREEEQMNVVDGYHVFFFEGALSEQQKRIFEETFVGFFNRLQSVLLRNRPKNTPKVSFSHNDYCAECFATTPAGDESWFAEYHSCCLNFSRNVARIASYQGRQFVS